MTTQKPASVLHYLKFSLFHILTLLSIVAIAMGSDWIVWGYLFVSLFIILGDMFLGNDESTPAYPSQVVLNLQLYLALPLLLALVLVSLWSVSSQDHFGLGSQFSVWFEYDFLASREQTALWQHVVSVFFVGLMISTVGTVTGHELVHRTWSNASMLTGRWLLAFSLDANFSIEHVFGHHRHVATDCDPASAPRGRNVYAHILISTIKGNISAWHIEAKRLKGKKLALMSYHNVCIRGYLMSLVLVCLAYLIAGVPGFIFFVASAIWAKCMLEIVNYVEHYGLVRVPGKRVEPRHSWNTNRKISSWALFNLSRHSHHHARSQTPYHKLNPYPQAPEMVTGYLASVFLALIPPLWFFLMSPRLTQWDKDYATDEERAIVEQMGL